MRFGTWSYASREKIRDGAINASFGELKGLGVAVSATTVRTWLRDAGLGPVGTRRGVSWREFLRTHRRSMLAVDFFTVETIWLAVAVVAGDQVHHEIDVMSFRAQDVGMLRKALGELRTWGNAGLRPRCFHPLKKAISLPLRSRIWKRRSALPMS